MEEESKKWNIEEEDAPEEGEPVGNEEFADDAIGEDDGEFIDSSSDGDEDDEDVLDLD